MPRRIDRAAGGSSTRIHAQVLHPHQIVGGEGQQELKVQLGLPDSPALVQSLHGLGSAKAFIDPLADPLADGVAGVTRGAPIDRRGALLSTAR